MPDGTIVVVDQGDPQSKWFRTVTGPGPAEKVPMPGAEFVNQMLVTGRPWEIREIGNLAAHQSLRLSVAAVKQIVKPEISS